MINISAVSKKSGAVQKFRQDRPLWPDEVQSNTVRWPLRFDFDIDYLLPSDKWEESKVASQDLSALARGGFQIVEEPMAIETVKGLGITNIESRTTAVTLSTHDQLVEALVEAGRIQRYFAEKEYRIDGERLDAVWKRIERSVPTFAFEVQVGGDLYHALGKLKHAFDIWNSRIFLVASDSERPKVQTLLSGTFHEISSELRFISIESFQKLLRQKKEVRQLEADLGLL
jgi:predicted RNA-binding protein